MLRERTFFDTRKVQISDHLHNPLPHCCSSPEKKSYVLHTGLVRISNSNYFKPDHNQTLEFGQNEMLIETKILTCTIKIENKWSRMIPYLQFAKRLHPFESSHSLHKIPKKKEPPLSSVTWNSKQSYIIGNDIAVGHHRKIVHKNKKVILCEAKPNQQYKCNQGESNRTQ